MMASLIRLTTLCLLLFASVYACDGKERVLILSGANNHDWKKTTPAIKQALEESGCFQVDVVDDVPAMKAEAFAPYSVILSNFNTFGENAPKKVWGEEVKQALISHLEKGRGLVIVHAGSTVFQDWPEFQCLACGTWKGKTKHGRIHANQVSFTDNKSPITKGLEPFWIVDEFRENVHVAPGATPLATVTPSREFGGCGTPQDIMHFTEENGGRGFALFLGHGVANMKNHAWRSLLQRGTEWAATGKVSIAPAADWPHTKEDAERQAR